MTYLRTEVAERLLTKDEWLAARKRDRDLIGGCEQEEVLKAQDAKTEALINKRWVDWIEACYLDIQKTERGDMLVTKSRTCRKFNAPVISDPNRFCPMSKE